ncbi:MAG: DNA photolyase [Methylococcales bacterium]|nr:DNA photolyase [Methylococcales bacterium]
MIDTIYYEQAVHDHHRTQTVLRRFNNALNIPIERYSAIFNRKAQNFRQQKSNPALVIAHKPGKLLHPAPTELALGGHHNYYFSHLYNCLYDCRYCFLQGRYRSAHYVWFVNYEDFLAEIQRLAAEHAPEPVYFFSGYDCDSLALEPVTGFAETFIPAVAKVPNAWLELRTKSTQISALLKQSAQPRILVACSLSPQAVIEHVEAKTPSLVRRVEALVKLQQAGWAIGLRFDPIIYHQAYQDQYRALFAYVFQRLEASQIHSVTLGTFRLPETYYKTLQHLYPDAKLLAGPLCQTQGQVTYQSAIIQQMADFCQTELARYLPASRVFSYL